MIENIRKYKGIILFGLALVIFALVIGIKDDIFRRGSAGGQSYIEVDGRTYTDKEFLHYASTFELATQLGEPDVMQFVLRMGDRSAQTRQAAQESFFVSRMVFQKAKEELGVYPGQEEISKYVRQMRAFTDADGNFKEEQYRHFIERFLAQLNLRESDFRDLISDVIASEQISKILGAGMATNKTVLAQNQALQSQQIDGQLARLDLEMFKKTLNPSEDELKKYWETIQDNFMTAPQRKFTYILVAPTLTDVKAEDDSKEAAANLTEEQKKQKEEEKAKKAAELAELNRKKQIELDSKVDDFIVQLEEQKGTGLEELAKKNQWEVKTTELFTLANPPKELDLNLRSSNRNSKVLEELFLMEITTDPLSKISQPFAVGKNQWIVARLDGEEKSRPKTYEEAKAEARDQYISDKAIELLKKAATEAHEKIKTSLAAGKSFADAAKEAGFKDVTPFTKVSRAHQPEGKEPASLFGVASNVDPGSLAETIVESDGAFIPFVSKREVVKEEKAAEQLSEAVDSNLRRNEIVIFSDWISSRVDAAKVKRLYKH